MTIHALDWPVQVRVRCDVCGRVIGRLYGDSEVIATITTREMPLGAAVDRGGRVDYFRRHGRCRARPVVKFSKLESAYRTAAARPSPRDRIVSIPSELPTG